MNSNPKNTNKNTYQINKDKNFINTKNTEDFSYLYPNGHRITHQMRWFNLIKEKDVSANNCL